MASHGPDITFLRRFTAVLDYYKTRGPGGIEDSGSFMLSGGMGWWESRKGGTKSFLDGKTRVFLTSTCLCVGVCVWDKGVE